MANSKATKKALFMSMLSLLLCFTMLMGATFAWFTDTVSNTGNRIQAGNLKVDLVMDKNDGNGYVSIAKKEGENAGDIFSIANDGNGINWEPGKTEVVYLGVRNNGSLALKYNIVLDIKDSGLADSLEYAIVDGVTSTTKYTSWEDVKAATTQVGAFPKEKVVAAQNGTLDKIAERPYDEANKGETEYFALAVHMKEEAGNEFQDKYVEIDVEVLATQLAAELDSFGPDYDEEAFVADYYVNTASELVEAIDKAGIGNTIGLMGDVKIDPANMSNAYGTTGIKINNGQILDGNGYTLDIKGAGGTWDSGINTTGGTIKNLTVTGSFRGIFINHNSTHSEPVILENVIIDGTTYTISCDQGMKQNLFAKNSTFNGWTSYAATLGKAEFVDCNFGEGNGYAYCRPYAPTAFVGCEFEAGYRMDARAAVTFENCTLDGVALTADNLATLVISNTANATVK